MSNFALRSYVRPVAATLMLAFIAPAVHAQQRLTLQQAVEMSERQSLQAHAALATLANARKHDQAFGERLLPQLSLNGILPAFSRTLSQITQPDGTIRLLQQENTISQVNMVMDQPLTLTGGDFQISSGLTRLDVTGGSNFTRTYNSLPYTLSISQPIRRPNEINWSRRVQDASRDLAERTYLETREAIGVTAAGAFFDLFTARTGIANGITNVAVNDTIYQRNLIRYRVGQASETDLLQSQLSLLNAQAALEQSRLDAQRALSALLIAIGAPDGTDYELVEPSDVPKSDPDTAVAVAQALQNRAFVVDARGQEIAADRLLAETKMSNNIGGTISAAYGTDATGPGFGPAYSNLAPKQSLVLQVSAPFFQWGAHHSDIEAAQANRASVEAALARTKAQSLQDVRFGALTLSQLRRSLGISALADSVAVRLFQVAYHRYTIGQVSITDLAVTEAAKDAAVQAYVAALRGYWVQFYTLRQLTLYDFSTGTVIE